jgi:formylmethanofuran dehydrogenase subunit E
MVERVTHGWLALTLALALPGCAASAPLTAAPPSPNGAASSASSGDEALARVTLIHGGAGPWAVAGYRMGQYALARLGLRRQSFDIEVVHRTPQEVQFSCIADGAAAATGASAGKLNLHLVNAPEADVSTTYRNRSTGQAVTLRPSRAFAARFRDVPREELAAAGRTVLGLPDADVFEELPVTPSP